MSMDRATLIREMIEAFEVLGRKQAASKFKISMKGEDRFLCVLSQLGGVSSPGAILEYTDFTNARLSVIIKRMEFKGLIEKKKDENDKRCTIVCLTAKGRKLAEATENELISGIGYVVDELGEDDAREFLRLLKKLNQIKKKR